MTHVISRDAVRRATYLEYRNTLFSLPLIRRVHHLAKLIISALGAQEIVKNLLQFPRTRIRWRNEYEADRTALIWLSRAGFDPSAVVHTYKCLSQTSAQRELSHLKQNGVEGGHKLLPSFLKTHPLVGFPSFPILSVEEALANCKPSMEEDCTGC